MAKKPACCGGARKNNDKPVTVSDIAAADKARPNPKKAKAPRKNAQATTPKAAPAQSVRGRRRERGDDQQLLGQIAQAALLVTNAEIEGAPTARLVKQLDSLLEQAHARGLSEQAAVAARHGHSEAAVSEVGEPRLAGSKLPRRVTKGEIVKSGLVPFVEQRPKARPNPKKAKGAASKKAPRSNLSESEVVAAAPKETGRARTPVILQHTALQTYRGLRKQEPDPEKRRSKAFAIATASLQDAGVFTPNSRKLTRFGRRIEREHTREDPEILARKLSAYERMLRAGSFDKAVAAGARQNPAAPCEWFVVLTDPKGSISDLEIESGWERRDEADSRLAVLSKAVEAGSVQLLDGRKPVPRVLPRRTFEGVPAPAPRANARRNGAAMPAATVLTQIRSAAEKAESYRLHGAHEQAAHLNAELEHLQRRADRDGLENEGAGAEREGRLAARQQAPAPRSNPTRRATGSNSTALRDRAKARKFWEGVPSHMRAEVAEAVASGFDWTDYPDVFEAPPSRAFLAELGRQAALWEEAGGIHSRGNGGTRRNPGAHRCPQCREPAKVNFEEDFGECDNCEDDHGNSLRWSLQSHRTPRRIHDEQDEHLALAVREANATRANGRRRNASPTLTVDLLTPEQEEEVQVHLITQRGKPLGSTPFKVGQRVSFGGAPWRIYDHNSVGGASKLVLVSPAGTIARFVDPKKVKPATPTRRNPRPPSPAPGRQDPTVNVHFKPKSTSELRRFEAALESAVGSSRAGTVEGSDFNPVTGSACIHLRGPSAERLEAAVKPLVRSVAPRAMLTAARRNGEGCAACAPSPRANGARRRPNPDSVARANASHRRRNGEAVATLPPPPTAAAVARANASRRRRNGIDWDGILKANPIFRDKSLKNKMAVWEALEEEGLKLGLPDRSPELAQFVAEGMQKAYPPTGRKNLSRHRRNGEDEDLEEGSRFINIPPEVADLGQGWWSGHGDPLYAVLSRYFAGGRYIVWDVSGTRTLIEASPAEIQRLHDMAQETLDAYGKPGYNISDDEMDAAQSVLDGILEDIGEGPEA